jgi:type I restriction enzyme S subunit
LNTGDIVIAMDRPVISTGLKVARIEPSDAGCLLVQRVARYVPSAFVENDFAWHFINSQIFIDHAVTQATGSDLPHISSNDILTAPLPLPILTEQQEIVRLIEKAFLWIDRLASETTNARKLIGHLDQAALAKAFRGELVPQDPTDEPASALLERIKAGRQATSMPRSRSKMEKARERLSS